MSYQEKSKPSPIVEVMGPSVWTILQYVDGQFYEVSEHRDVKQARRALSDIRDENPQKKYKMVEEERPDLAPNTPLKKMQPSGWRM